MGGSLKCLLGYAMECNGAVCKSEDLMVGPDRAIY